MFKISGILCSFFFVNSVVIADNKNSASEQFLVVFSEKCADNTGDAAAWLERASIQMKKMGESFLTIFPHQPKNETTEINPQSNYTTEKFKKMLKKWCKKNNSSFENALQTELEKIPTKKMTYVLIYSKLEDIKLSLPACNSIQKKVKFYNNVTIMLQDKQESSKASTKVEFDIGLEKYNQNQEPCVPCTTWQKFEYLVIAAVVVIVVNMVVCVIKKVVCL